LGQGLGSAIIAIILRLTIGDAGVVPGANEFHGLAPPGNL
jgi:hypothetical protein